MALRQRTNAYWAKRANERLVESEKTSDKYRRQIRKVYAATQRDTLAELKKIYANYWTKEGGFDKQKLNLMTSSGDMRQFVEKLKKARLYDKIPANYLGRINRLEYLNAQMWYEAHKAGLEQDKILTEANRKVYEDSYYKSVYDVSKGIGSTPTFATLDTQTVDKVLETKFDGKNYSERVWGNSDILANQLKDKLAQAIANGQSIQKTAKDFRERFGVQNYYAERLIRTETNYFHNTAEIDSYESMGFEYYEFLATLDSRTSEICQHMDGKRFKVSEGKPGENMPPLHPNCRSTIVPYFKGYEPETRLYRDPETGKNKYIYNVDFDEWRKQMGESYDLAVARQKAEASRKSRNRTKSLADTMSESATKYINNKLKGAPDERRVFNAYKDKVMVSNTSYKNTAHFNPNSQSIVFNLKKDSYGSKWSDKYRVMIHESGHNIDFLSAKGKGYTSIQYKDGLFIKKLKEEANKLFSGQYRTIDGVRLSPQQQIRRYVKQNFLEKDYSYLSDIFSGVTKNKFHLGAYHKASYWNDRSLAVESFTEMYSAAILNKTAIKLIKKYFPESYGVYRDIIKEIGGNK